MSKDEGRVFDRLLAGLLKAIRSSFDPDQRVAEAKATEDRVVARLEAHIEKHGDRRPEEE